MIPVVSRMVSLLCQMGPEHPMPNSQMARPNTISTRSNDVDLAVQVARTLIRSKNVKQKVPTQIPTNADLSFQYFMTLSRVVSTFTLMVEANFSILATTLSLVNIPKIPSITSPVLPLIWQSILLKKMAPITLLT